MAEHKRTPYTQRVEEIAKELQKIEQEAREAGYDMGIVLSAAVLVEGDTYESSGFIQGQKKAILDSICSIADNKEVHDIFLLVARATLCEI